MNSKSKLIFFIIGAITLSVFGYGSVMSASELKTYRVAKTEYSEKLAFGKRLLNVNEWLDRSGKSDGLLQEAEQVKRSYVSALAAAKRYSLLAGIAVLAFLLFVLFMVGDITWRVSGLIVSSLACLIVGLAIPMLEIGAYLRDLTIPLEIDGGGLLAMALGTSKHFPGDIYFYYQSKSVLEIIELLLEQRNYVVGLSILAFSVLIPAIKLISSAWIYLKRELSTKDSKWTRLVLIMGKWSMADVFVAGIFLSSLAFNNMNPGLQSESRVLPGIYFFLAYCILSIYSSVLIQKHFVHSDQSQ